MNGAVDEAMPLTHNGLAERKKRLTYGYVMRISTDVTRVLAARLQQETGVRVRIWIEIMPVESTEVAAEQENDIFT